MEAQVWDIWKVNSLPLPECQKCKKVIMWSGDFGMDQYVSWGYPKKTWT